MNFIQKTIFATFWDYKQAGILEPNINSDRHLLTNFLKLSTYKKSKIKLDQGNLENQNSKKISKKFDSSSNILNQKSFCNDLIIEVENLAKASQNISSLEKNIMNFKKFYSLKGSKKLVLGNGNPNSEVLFVSEPPSYEEEIEQRPYVGSSLELFDKIVESMGLVSLKKNNCNIFVIPSIPFRLVKTTDKKISDLELMKPFLKRYIEIISPKYLIFISKMPVNILGINDFLKFKNEQGYLGKYLGIPTIEIEGIKSMIEDPHKKRKTWNNIKLMLKFMKKENE